MTPHVPSRARELARDPRAARLSERLARLARPTLVPAEVVTDSRKFMKMGVFRSLARCLAILLCYELRLPVPTRAFFAPIR